MSIHLVYITIIFFINNKMVIQCKKCAKSILILMWYFRCWFEIPFDSDLNRTKYCINNVIWFLVLGLRTHACVCRWSNKLLEYPVLPESKYLVLFRSEQFSIRDIFYLIYIVYNKAISWTCNSTFITLVFYEYFLRLGVCWEWLCLRNMRAMRPMINLY